MSAASASAAIRPGQGAATRADLARFRGVDAWVFDLDNTLYPSHLDIFPQIQQRVGEFVARRLGIGRDEAVAVEKDYHHRYGATLRGLIIEHGIEPDEFLEYVHDIDHSSLAPNPVLGGLIARLPGKHYILTNGSRRHAENIATRLGITEHFHDIFDIVWAGHLPKPSEAVYRRLIEHTGLDPRAGAMFEDLTRNLIVPRQLGMATVLIVPDGTEAVVDDAWQTQGGGKEVDFMTGDLAGFLDAVLGVVAPA